VHDDGKTAEVSREEWAKRKGDSPGESAKDDSRAGRDSPPR
jgi:hypothetical protein